MKIRATLIAISPYLGAKFDFGHFIFFLCLGSTILHKKFQVISSKNEGVTAIFAIFDFFFNFLSKFKVQGLDIVTLLGAKGPQ